LAVVVALHVTHYQLLRASARIAANDTGDEGGGDEEAVEPGG